MVYFMENPLIKHGMIWGKNPPIFGSKPIWKYGNYSNFG